MRFASPEWLLLLPILALIAWWWRPARLYTPLRAAGLLLLVLLLADPQWRRLQTGLDLWVLLDQSASAESQLQARLPEWEALLQRSMSRDDRIFFVDFADEAIMRGDDETLAFTGNRELTRTHTAIRFTLGRMSSSRASRILALTDGYSTEPLAGLEQRLLAQQIPLDYRILGSLDGPDYRVQSLELPQRVQAGEPFLVDVSVTGRPDGEVPYTLLRNRQRVANGTVKIERGRGRVRFAERITGGGSHLYQVRLHPEKDVHPGNNVAENWIEVQGGPRILLITGYLDDPLAPILQAQGFEVDIETSPLRLEMGRLSGARAVIINNVPADRIPPEFIQAIDFFVRAEGGGLLMAGGKQSFGAGGYYGTPVEELLPVSTELRQEHRRLAAAMAIVLDRSGSMNAMVPGGQTKMDLANVGAAQTIDLLGNGDAVAVFAVDTEPHLILPLTVLGSDRIPLTRTVRRITSAGGGIYVYNGLKAAWEQLQQANQGQRHIILFADAQDAEQPGDYKRLIAEMVAQGVTISVIGLGSEIDSDAAFLRDVAERGNGRIFFNADASQLPAIFAQETIAVARSTFIDEPTPFVPASGWLEIAARHPQWLEAVDGYNLSYLKPEATGALFTSDEYEAPLVAFWHRGMGRTAAIAFPLGGDFSNRIRTWPGYPDFTQTLSRWLAGEDVPPGLFLNHRIDGERLTLELHYDDEWENLISRNAPRLMIARGHGGRIEELIWERMEPGRFVATTRLEPASPFRGTAQIGQHTVSFGPVVLGRSPEWDFDLVRVHELRHLSRVSGGEERLDLSKVWQADRRPSFSSLQAPLLILLLLLVILEVLHTRLGARWIAPRRALVVEQARIPKAARRKRGETPTPSMPRQEEQPEAPETEPASVDDAAARRRERFDRAKRRGF
jgi:hypothetical protein